MEDFYNKKLKLIRQRLNLSQSEIADKLGFTQGHYSQLEIGKKKIDEEQFNRMCIVLGVDPKEELGVFFVEQANKQKSVDSNYQYLLTSIISKDEQIKTLLDMMLKKDVQIDRFLGIIEANNNNTKGLMDSIKDLIDTLKNNK